MTTRAQAPSTFTGAPAPCACASPAKARLIAKRMFFMGRSPGSVGMRRAAAGGQHFEPGGWRFQIRQLLAGTRHLDPVVAALLADLAHRPVERCGLRGKA